MPQLPQRGVAEMRECCLFVVRPAVDLVDRVVGHGNRAVVLAQRHAVGDIVQDRAHQLAFLFDLALRDLLFLEQAGAFDRDCGLIGEGADPFDLTVGKRVHRQPAESDRTDRHAVAQQRNAKNGAHVAGASGAGIGGVLSDIVDLDRFSIQDRASDGGAGVGRSAARSFRRFVMRRQAMADPEPANPILYPVQRRSVGPQQRGHTRENCC